MPQSLPPDPPAIVQPAEKSPQEQDLDNAAHWKDEQEKQRRDQLNRDLDAEGLRKASETSQNR